MFGAVVSALDQVTAGLTTLASVDPRTLSPGEVNDLAVAVWRLQERAHALTDQVTRALELHGNLDSTRGSAPLFLATHCKVARPAARASLSRGRALESMPKVADAYEAGAVSADHVRLLAAGQRSAPATFARVESELVGCALDLNFDAFRRQAETFRMVADPDGTERRALHAFERRRAHASKTFENTTAVDATLDPIGGAIYRRELDRLEQQLFEADWAGARARLGTAATERDLQRTPQQRRADAMVQMAIRSAAMPADAKQARVLLSVLVGYETFAGTMSQLADGTVVSPGQVVPWLSDADVERVVFDGPSRVIDVGVRRRLFTGATRRAVELRDLTCTFDGCEVPFERCDIDHIQRYEDGGLTTRDNGRVRCPAHNPGRRRPRQPPPPPRAITPREDRLPPGWRVLRLPRAA